MMGLVITAGTIVGGMYFAKRQREQRQHIWEEAAAMVGGQFETNQTAWYQSKKLQVSVLLDGVSVHIDCYSRGMSSQNYTRLTAASTGAPHFKLSVLKGSSSSARNVTFGDVPFDNTFVVKSSDKTLCQAWLTQEARDQMLSCQGYLFSIKDGEGQAVRTDVETDAETLACAIRAMAAFAGGGKRLSERVQQAADVLRGSATYEPNAFIPEETRMEWQHQGLSCYLGFAEREQTLFQGSGDVMTCVKLRHTSTGRHFYMTHLDMPDAAQRLPEVPIGEREFAREHRLRARDPESGALFSRELTERLQRLPYAGISSDEHFVTLWLRGIILEPAQLTLACDTIAPLVMTPELDPYR